MTCKETIQEQIDEMKCGLRKLEEELGCCDDPASKIADSFRNKFPDGGLVRVCKSTHGTYNGHNESFDIHMRMERSYTHNCERLFAFESITNVLEKHRLKFRGLEAVGDKITLTVERI